MTLKAQGITFGEFGKSLGVSYQSVSNYLSGRQYMSDALLVKAAICLGVSVPFLLDLTDNPDTEAKPAQGYAKRREIMLEYGRMLERTKEIGAALAGGVATEPAPEEPTLTYSGTILSSAISDNFNFPFAWAAVAPSYGYPDMDSRIPTSSDSLSIREIHSKLGPFSKADVEGTEKRMEIEAGSPIGQEELKSCTDAAAKAWEMVPGDYRDLRNVAAEMLSQATATIDQTDRAIVALAPLLRGK